jgi:protein TonB
MSTPASPAPGLGSEQSRGIVSSGWLAAEPPTAPSRRRRFGGAFGASLALHGGVLLLVLAIFAVTPTDTLNNLQDQVIHMVYLQQPGPGGGGGGSPAPAPPKPMEIPKHKMPDPIPMAPPPPVPPPPVPPPTLNAPVMTNNAETIQSTGQSSVSLAAYGGGGRGAGVGSGRGNGVGPGEGGGFGGGAYRPGNGVRLPTVVHEVKPTYTAEAMRNKLQGSVELEAVVMPDGSVGQVRVTKSLDRATGLDDEAVKAAKQWQFSPAVDRDGKPVAIIVQLILDFRLH